MTTSKQKLAQEVDLWVRETIKGCKGWEQEKARLLENIDEGIMRLNPLIECCNPFELAELVSHHQGLQRFFSLFMEIGDEIQNGTSPLTGEPLDAVAPQPDYDRPAEREQIRRDISFLPAYTEIIIGELAQTEEQFLTFVEAKHKPHVLDDGIIDRAVRLYEDQLAFIPLHEKQLNWWLSETLTDAQRFQVEDLKKKLPTLQAKTEALLQLLAELRKGTINRILEMSDEELALKLLSGEIKRP